jgi:hypothetical protein
MEHQIHITLQFHLATGKVHFNEIGSTIGAIDNSAGIET